MVFGIFSVELRAVVTVEAGVVIDNGCTWYWKRREKAFHKL